MKVDMLRFEIVTFGGNRSQAGKAFSLREFGMFWAATPLKYWPRAPHEVCPLPPFLLFLLVRGQAEVGAIPHFGERERNR